MPEPAAVTVPAPAPVAPAEASPAPAAELPVPDLTVPALTVPALTVPALTVPESWVAEVAQESPVAEPEFDLSLLGGDPLNPALGGLASKVSS
ncbi:MAG: 2-oxoglutarate dehydrogenase, E2 component, dihydrolipoamide succinyltransferase, partial [Actinomycetes bacterium]